MNPHALALTIAAAFVDGVAVAVAAWIPNAGLVVTLIVVLFLLLLAITYLIAPTTATRTENHP